MRRQPLRVLFTLSMFLTITISAFGQADVSSATVKGTVTDPLGSAVPSATVTARSLDQGVTRSAATGADGGFQILTLRPGLYEIMIQAQGFAQHLIKEVRLTVGQTAVYNISLELAKVTNEVTVTTSAPLIEVERTQQANTIESKQIESLPNVTRDFTAYIFTLPGVSSSAAPRVQGGARFNFGSSGFSIGGSNGRNNLVTVDGGENEYGSGQLRYTNLSAEAVQEYQVNRNGSSAENGFTAGTAINVVTKSGTNNFHGSGYVFYRSQKISGHNPVNFRPGEEKPFNQQIFPGFTFGGPIVKNKLFFFTNYEKTKSDVAQTRRYTNSPFLQPSLAQNALLDLLSTKSTNATIRGLAASLRAALTTTADRYPNTLKLLTDNEGSFVNRDRLNFWITKIDYQPSERDSISARFSYLRNFFGQLGGVNLVAPNRANTLTVRDYTTLLTWTRNVSSNIVNTARVQVAPRNKAFTEPVTPDSASLIIDGSAFGSFGRDFTAPFNTLQDRLQVEDNLAWIKGDHTIKFGGSYRPVRYIVRNELWFSGDWTFSSGTFPITTIVPAALVPAFNAEVSATGGSLAGTQLTGLQSFNFGLPVTVRQGFNNPLWKGNGQYLAFFAQDTWKVNRRLTVDYGGRVDYDGEPQPLPRSAYFSPRLGFALDVAGDQKTVVRGSGGIYYAPVNYQVVYVTNLLNDSGLFINQVLPTASDPGTRSSIALWAYGLSIGKLPFKSLSEADFNARGVSTGRGAFNRVIFQADPDYKNNYSIQTSLGVQRRIMRDLSLDVAYQMYRGVHLQRSHQINYRESATPNSRGPAFGPAYVRIDPSIAQLNNYESTGNSIYHGMTVSLTKRLSDHFQFQTNYTFSKTIDDITDYNSGFSAAFPTRLDQERSISSFDIRHNFVASGYIISPFKNWALRDITLSPIVYIRSGIPFTLYTGVDTNGDTHTNDRLSFIGRNTGVGPNFRSVDMRLTKSFRFKGDSSMRVDFVVEANNLLNRTNFAAVNDVIGTNLNSEDYQAGTVRLRGRRDRAITQPLGFIAAFDPRRFQFGLKLVF